MRLDSTTAAESSVGCSGVGVGKGVEVAATAALAVVVTAAAVAVGTGVKVGRETPLPVAAFPVESEG